MTQYAVAEESDDLETIIGLLTGALIVILTLIIVAVMFWRSNRFSTNKNHTIQPPGNVTSLRKTESHTALIPRALDVIFLLPAQ